MIILFTKYNLASINIATEIASKTNSGQTGAGGIGNDNVKLIDAGTHSVLDVPSDFGDELVIVLSTHKSKIKEKIFTAHFPGNWNKAELGGTEKTLVRASVPEFKILCKKIKEAADSIGWKFSMEADHHGPTGFSPMIFVEIGSGEEEWRDKNASKAMAGAILRAVDAIDAVDAVNHANYRIALAFGGGHYPKVFNRIQIEDENIAISHICPKYAIDSVDEAMFIQAVEKTNPKPTMIIISKEETNARQCEKIIAFARNAGLEIREI